LAGVAAATVGVAFIALSVDAPISMRAILVVVVILAACSFCPDFVAGIACAARHLESAGLLLALAYIGATAYAHHVALARVDHFSSSLRLEVQSRGALPFPPSLWHWDGLVLTPRGVYELRMNLGPNPQKCKQQAPSLRRTHR